MHAALLADYYRTMFTVNTSKRITHATTAIIQHVDLSTLLAGSSQTTEIPLCPTHAISIVENSIDIKRCIACAICGKLMPEAIRHSPEQGDIQRFIDYCRIHKMFVYRWLCLSSANMSAADVFIRGFSRNKRVPFVSLGNGFVRFCKCAHNVQEVEKAKADLDDMAKLALNAAEVSSIDKSIVLIQGPSNEEERQYISRLNGYTLFELIELYKTFTGTLLLSV